MPGPLNVTADMLSRGRPNSGEWILHLFVSRESSHCLRFFSLMNDDPPLGWDALVHPWPQTLLYAFPPFTLRQDLLHRVQMEQVRLILVAPFWPQMFCYSTIPTPLEAQP